MRRRQFLIASGALLAIPTVAHAQRSPKRIGFLNIGSPATSIHLLQAIRTGMQELGYVDGRDFVIEVRWAQGDVDRLATLARELVALPVDVIVAGGPPQVRAARQATSTIPIVMASGADPVALGFAASLSRPGGNITGSTNMATETAGKLVEFAHELVPGTTRIAIMLSDSPSMKDNLADAQQAAARLNCRLIPASVANAGQIDSAFAQALKGGAEALVVVTDAFLMSQRKAIVDLAARRRLPAVYTRKEYVEAGGLVSYGVNLTALWRRAAVFIDKIFKGAKPGEIPFEQPTTFELVLNMRTAKALGLTIPQSVLLRADHVIR